MNVVTLERTRTCIRCHERFTEPAGTVTRICDDCPGRRPGASLGAAGGNVVDRGRERSCIRCGERFLEVPGEISRLCRSCDPDHVVLD
ncbi:putative nucleic acid-binding Zn-ribbon protein [Halorubrum trapanicum]|uniref:Putative nucleic acid-binding Zn-ribbon protein n=1 Tax=Halorubrum trapanicum TaxID=29284 RepID=A0A8J7ULG4_9EURY|nr:hypothetical protein [Halorubrum trapanicum]MBP1901024.1 putative nucleic acid-binding Zn-ribbon protein [Halorubrum trapanicum]